MDAGDTAMTWQGGPHHAQAGRSAQARVKVERTRNMTVGIPIAAATNWIKFFGHFHPLLVHLPIGFLVLLGALELAGRFKNFQHITAARGFILVMLAIAAVFTITCGWLLASGGGYGHRVLFWHRWLGTSVGVLSLVLLGWWFYRKKTGVVYYSTLISALVVMTIAAHFGGTLTFGSRYLSKYAPPLLKPLLSYAPPRHSALPATDAGINASSIRAMGNASNTGVRVTLITDLRSDGSFYGRYIQRIFTDNCTRCHGRDRQKGRLRLDSYYWLRRGSNGRPVVIPYNADRSKLYQRLTIPLWQRHHMPPRHHHQLTTSEIALIRWWIQTGASGSATLHSLRPPENIRRIIQSMTPRRLNEDDRANHQAKPIAMGVAADNSASFNPPLTGRY